LSPSVIIGILTDFDNASLQEICEEHHRILGLGGNPAPLGEGRRPTKSGKASKVDKRAASEKTGRQLNNDSDSIVAELRNNYT